MKKKVLSLAIAAAMVPGFAAAADVSGFANIDYTIANDSADNASGPGTTNDKEGKFGAKGEVDFSASPADGVTVRVDVDLSLDPGTSASGAEIEQAFFAWGVTEGVTVIGGVFNNPIGMQAEDVTEKKFMSHGVVYNVLDHQTALDGDNIAGLAVAGAVGPVTLTGAYLNDLQHVDEENSFALVANYSPIKGLDLEVGFVTQADQTTHNNQGTGNVSAGDVTNFNVSYAIEQVKGLTVGLDYLMADKVVDSAYEFFATYTMDNGLGFGVRLENVGWEASGAEDSERTTFNVSYQVASNLKAVLEVADGDNKNAMTTVTGIEEDGVTTLNLIAKF